jgi:hypothetical protein
LWFPAVWRSFALLCELALRRAESLSLSGWVLRTRSLNAGPGAGGADVCLRDVVGLGKEGAEDGKSTSRAGMSCVVAVGEATESAGGE